METLVYLIKLEKRQNLPLKRNRLSYLYSLNSGALMQNGLSLPIILDHSGEGSERGLKRLLEKTGFDVTLTAEEGFSHKLIISIDESSYSWYLMNPEGEVLYENKSDYEKLNGNTYRGIVMDVFDTVYAYRF